MVRVEQRWARYGLGPLQQARDAQSHPSIGVTVFLHIHDVRHLDAYRLELGFSDGRRGIADLEAELVGPVFSQLRDPDLSAALW